MANPAYTSTSQEEGGRRFYVSSSVFMAAAWGHRPIESTGPKVRTTALLGPPRKVVNTDPLGEPKQRRPLE